MVKTLNIGLLGCGNVGTVVAELLQKNAALLLERTEQNLQIKKIAVRDLKKRRDVDANLLTTDIMSVVNDPEIQVIVELMGDYPEALAAMETALKNKKHVVTANKAAIAKHGLKLFKLAKENNVRFLFEASVAGGIPILRSLREGLCANQIHSLRGIINGTSNYILSEMASKKLPFEDALKTAQELGYAEADPTSDVEGIDAAYKLCILVMLCYGVWIPVSEIFTQGISQITQLDFQMAKQFRYAIKLLGIANNNDGKISARVHPVLVSRDNPIAHIGGAFNAIQYNGDFVGEGMLYGRGAGGGPTASAVVSDIMEISRTCAHSDHTALSPTGFSLDRVESIKPIPMGDISCPYYLRLTVIDKPNVLSQITTILGQNNISIQHVYQHGSPEERIVVPVIVVTHRAKEKNIQQALQQIDKLDSVVQATQLIRIEEG